MAFLIYSRINNAGSSSARSELDPQSQGIGDGAGKYCLKTFFLLEKFKVRKKKIHVKITPEIYLLPEKESES